MVSHPSPGDGLADAVAERVVQMLAYGPANLPGSGRDEQRLYGNPVTLPGGVLSPPLNEELAIAGVELTQSIQYKASAGTGGYEPDNSIPLVALKTLVARVYPSVRQGLISHGLVGSRVSGELTISIGDRVVYRTGPTRPTGARLGLSRSLDRTLWDQELTFPVPSGSGSGVVEQLKWEALNCSLNFVIPAYYCRAGRMVVSVAVWQLLADGGRGAGTSWWQRVEFVNVSPPRLCLVRVNWTNSSGNRFSPADKDMLDTLSLATRMLPFPYFETTVLSSVTNTSAAFAMGPSSPGACNPAWDQFVADLAVLGIFTALFGIGDIVVGFVPSGALPPGAGNIVVGCGRGGLGLFVNQQTTFAHELGHIYERRHVAVPGDPNNDTAYPKYGGSSRSIGEVGIDTGTVPPTLFDPANCVDLMAYPVQSESQWISPYTYQNIFDRRGLHQTAPANPARVRSRLVLSVRIDRAGVVTVRRALRVDAAGDVPRYWERAISPLSVDVLDARGAILMTHHCLYVAPRGCGGDGGCGCGYGGPVPAGREPWFDMDEVLEWPAGAASLAFHTGGEAIRTIAVGEPPHLEVSEVQRAEGRIRFTIVTRHPRETPSVAVLFTGDDGVTWWPIAMDPPDGRVDVSETDLPARGHSRFRVIATAELQSAVADTGAIQLAPAPRRAYVVVPDDTCPIAAGPVRLAVVMDLTGHSMPRPADIRWRSDIEGDLGVGFEITPALSAGSHEITVIGSNGIGGTFEERAIIIVGG